MQIGEPDPVWRVELFGGLTAVAVGKRITRFRTRKTASLFAYLSFHHDRPHSREVLTDMFWPEANLDAGRQSLRMALSALREALETEDGAGTVVVSDRSTVQITGVRTDVDEFEDAVSGPNDLTRLARALRSVKGPLLQGFDDHWIVAQWLRLEEAYAQAAVRLMDTALDQGAVKDAILIGKEATALLGPREDVHLSLIKLYVADGSPGQAIAQFEDLERTLDEQWGETPSDKAYQVLEAVPKGAKPPGRVPRPSVPARTSSFVGRESETDDALDRLLDQGVRLLTLIGPGGSGKTALAREVATRAVESFAGRVWLVELADLAQADRICGAVLETVAGPTDKKAGPDDVGDVLGDGPGLLVLDNLEQLLPDGALQVKSLLERVPGLTVLATSRMTLGLDGEHVFRVPPLPVPSVQAKPSEIARSPSVALFVDRAAAVTPEFRLGPDNAFAVAEICRRLDGLPLAVEIAAAKTVTGSPAQILSKLGGSVDFLVSRKRDVPDRHQSLRAALDWSIGLLDEGLKATFSELSVFRGGLTLAAGESVTRSRNFEDDLARLVEASLVQAEPSGAEPRFRLLEPVREYAAEGLEPLHRAEIRRRHFEAFLKLAQGQGLGNLDPGSKAWLDALHRDHENLCAAFESVWDGVIDCRQAIELVAASRDMFRPRGHTAVWRVYVAELWDTLGPEQGTWVKAAIRLEQARLSSNALDGATVRAMYEEGLVLAQETGDPAQLATAHAGFAGALKFSGEYERSIGHYEEAAASFEALEDHRGLANTIRQMAMSYASMGDHEMTYETLKRALPHARISGEADALAWTLTDLGVEHAIHGHLEESKECFREAHETCRQTNNVHMQSIVYWQQAESELRTRRPAESVATHRLSVVCALEANFKDGLKWILLSFGCALAENGQDALALKTLARTAKWREVERRMLSGDEHEIYGPARAALEDRLGTSFESQWRAAESCDLDALIDELVAL
ncbi:MAG: tetratricopeptide repeat protein [Armatimonadetes bacterium]|nr:tetratricopeptide repeat protein [Armatimonadota bacterium]